MALLLALVAAPPAVAAPLSPTGLAPDGGAVSGIPVLSWDRVEGATSYDVQVSGAADFSTLISSARTVNLRFVPTAQLPVGDVWWRVRAIGASGSSDWTTVRFDRSSVSGPALLSPGDGKQIQPPHDATALTWTPVEGVTEYSLEISTDAGFIDPAYVTAYKTKATSYVVPSPQLATQYFWRVRGLLRPGTYTEYSEVRDYEVLALPAAQRRAPAPVPDDEVSFPAVADAVLDWDPVAGAKTYDLQISTDISFGIVDHEVNGVTGTSYAKPQTLNNDQYYWRVRPVDINSNKPAWNKMPVWRFRRAWDEQPKLEYPADGATVGDPLHFEWSPVKLASAYTLEMSPNATFSPADTVDRCSTTNTTFTPSSWQNNLSDCFPNALGTYYWRVIAQDKYETSSWTPVPGTDQVAAEVRSFTYDPARVSLRSPAHGAEVKVPTLSWQPLAGAAKYKVTITSTASGSTTSITTAATSFTPRALLAEGGYRWQVQPVGQDNRLGSGTLIGSQRTFTVVAQDAATAPRPEPLVPDQSSSRFPTLSWSPVQDATVYRIFVRKAGTVGFTQLSSTFRYPAGEDEGTTYLAPADYEWIVEAYNGSTYLATTESPGRFTITPSPSVTGHRIALTAAGLNFTATSCGATLPNECQNLRQTPVLAWDSSPNVGYYQIYLSRDRELTNLFTGYPMVVNSTEWIPTTSLADSQAGSAYFWYVRPCTAGGHCGAVEYAGHAFNKLSNPVELLAPADGSTQQDDITLTWSDYLLTNTNADSTDTALPTPARTEAMRYQVQVSTDPAVQTGFLDDKLVDQTSFTSYENTYPEGPVYWRVRAIDGSGNPLPWSEIRSFNKQSPTPTPTAPVGDSSSEIPEVSGNVQLFWSPLNFASSYDVEINKNNDTNPASQVLSRNSKQVTLSVETPLAVSNQPYLWRVRRVDAKGRKGGWSEWHKFKVTGTPPTLLSPADGARVAPSESMFSWEPSAGATPTTYKFERAALGSSTVVESATTAARSYAPTSVIAQGEWQWRVTALDAANSPIGTSPWRAFTVFSGPQSLTPPVVDGSGKVGTVLNAKPGTWDLDGVTETYQWIRGSSAITDATALTYLVTSADLGRELKLKVTGSKPGWSNTVVYSNIVTGVTGEAPTATSPVAITGTGKVGSVLQSTPAQWSVDGVTEKYQWLRDGENISWANGSTYTVSTADVGKAISLRVTATKTGLASGMSDSNALTALPGDGPVNTALPSITGTRSVGNHLSASVGSWDGYNNYTYQWLRNGVAISGATSSSYTIPTRDAGQVLSVRVTASRTGYESTSATSARVRIAKLASTTAASLVARKIKPTQRGQVKVVVSVPGVPRPTGTISIYRGTSKLKSVTLPKTARGRMTITLPRLKVGKHPITARYSGTSAIAPSRSGRVVLAVAR